MRETNRPFYVTGGTLRPDAPCYIEREADGALLRALREGELCYVLTARQTGKSSLMVRTATRLRSEGLRVAVLDLTLIGQQLTQEQWYRGLLDVLGEQLDLEDELEEYWIGHSHLGPTRRWGEAIRQVALPRCPAGLVLFIDEVDAVQALPFQTDEFFAAIRAYYNGRVADEDVRRLTFCLLGVAAPSDLIQDPRNTPFNIGRRIELADFLPAEAEGLLPGLEYGGSGRTHADALRLLHRVLHWTAGHPSLTQQLCKAVADQPAARHPREVDHCCEALFLSPGARRRDEHLLFVQEWLLRSSADLPELLETYARLPAGRTLEDRPGRTVELLHLAGIVRSENGRLRIRNRIFQRVFDREWVSRHLPAAEARRQQAAYRRGVLRASLIAGTMVALLAAITLLASSNELRTRAMLRQRDDLLGRLQTAVRELTRQQQATSRQAQRAERAHAFAVRQRRKVEEQRRQAWRLERQARERAAENHRQVVALQVSTGTTLAEAGRLPEALAWFTAALARDAGNPAREQAHRMRIASVQSGMPALLHLWNSPPRATSLAISPDNRMLAIASEDGTVTLRNAETGNQTGPCLHSRTGVASLAFRADGQRLLLVEEDWTARIWNPVTGQPVGPVLGRPGDVLSADFTSTGQVFAIDQRGLAQLWDPVTGARAGSPVGDLIRPPLGALSLGGRWGIGFAPWDLRLWDLQERQTVARAYLGAHAWCVSPDGGRLATAGDGELHLWTVPALRPLVAWPLPPARVLAVRFSRDGSRVTTIDSDGLVQERGAVDGRVTTPPRRLASPVLGAVLTSDGRHALVANPGGLVRWWDLARGRAPAMEIQPPPSAKPAVVSPDRRLAITVGRDGMARLWRCTPAAPGVVPLRQCGTAVACAAFSPDGRIFATSSVGQTPRIWDSRTLRPLGPSLSGSRNLSPSERFEQLAISPDHRWLIACSSDHRAEVFDLSTGRPVSSLGECWDLPAQPFSRDGCLVVLSEGEWGRPRLLIRKGDRYFPRVSLPHGQMILGLSPGGDYLLTFGRDGVAWLWDIRASFRSSSDGHRLRAAATALVQGDRVLCGSFSPDGKRILLGSSDGTARIWDVASRKPILPPIRQQRAIRQVAFSGGGSRFATINELGIAQLWDSRNGAPLSVGLQVEPGCPPQLDADGDCLLLRLPGGEVRVWEFSSDARPLAQLVSQSKVLAGQQVSGPAGLSPLTVESINAAWKQLQGHPLEAVRLRSERELVWLRREIEPTPVEQLSPAARAQLSVLIARYPYHAELRWKRGVIRAESQHWAAAAQDFASAIQLGREDRIAHYCHALTRLGADDLAGYQAACQELIRRSRRVGDERTYELAAWTCGLGPCSPEVALTAAEPLRRRLAAHPDDSSCLSTLAGLLYRAGHTQEALATFRQARALRQQEEDPAETLLWVLALANAGRTDEARGALVQVNRRLQEIGTAGAKSGYRWDDLLVTKLLRREAQSALRPRSNRTAE